MAQAKYATSTIAITTNDAAFLSHLLEKYMKDENFTTAYLTDLVNYLNPKAGC
jgi:hypothetical protein